MKKMKYIGTIKDIIVMIPGAPVVVNNGDVIDAPDDFSNANFEEVTATQTSTNTSASK